MLIYQACDSATLNPLLPSFSYPFENNYGIYLQAFHSTYQGIDCRHCTNATLSFFCSASLIRFRIDRSGGHVLHSLREAHYDCAKLDVYQEDLTPSLGYRIEKPMIYIISLLLMKAVNTNKYRRFWFNNGSYNFWDAVSHIPHLDSPGFYVGASKRPREASNLFQTIDPGSMRNVDNMRVRRK